MHILVVEDDPNRLHAIGSSLEKFGETVLSAPNLEQAREKLNSEKVDVILLDLTLADSSGPETFFHIKLAAAGVPIVVYVSLSEQDLALAAIEEGAEGYVIKGIASDEAIYKRLQFAVDKSAMEERLKRSEKRLRIILENSYDAFISTDGSWRITDWNRKAEMTFGWQKNEIIGKRLSTIVPSHFRIQYAKKIEKYFARGEQYFSGGDKNLLQATYELVGTDKEANEFPIDITIFKIKEDEDYMYCAFVRDISESKKLSEELERRVDERTEELTRSNEELKQFAKIASHDLQEPLRAVQGFANLLSENAKEQLDKDSQEFIEYILDGTNRMQQLIQAVLTHSHISHEPGSNPQTSCRSVIDDVLANLSVLIRETEASFEIEDLPEVAVERSHLLQLFQNLISNALKYRSEKKPRIVIKADNSGDYWLFSVRDNGIGIDSKYSDRIFDMFARLHGKTQYSGTGMGLAICKRIVTSHGGTISVESEPGEGSIFLFSLPAVKT